MKGRIWEMLVVAAIAAAVCHLLSIKPRARLSSIEAELGNRVTLESLESSESGLEDANTALLGIFAKASAKQEKDIRDAEDRIDLCTRQIDWLDSHLSVLFERLGQGRRPTGLGEMPE